MVTYELQHDARGRARAERVAFVGQRSAAVASREHSNVSLVMAAAFLVFVAGLTLAGRLPFTVLWLYLAASSVAFAAYALDKSAARRDQWRTQESTLHLFALVGGWPGALAAQRLLRHKSKKRSFQVVFWTTVVLNCGALGWLLSSAGAAMLRAVLGAT